MKVFISYAHTPGDTPVAQYLAARLRDIGIDTWLDEAKLRGGDLLQPAIEKAIGESNAGLFIISPSWLEREWTAFELDQFDRRDPRVVRRIPILRSNRKELSLPPPLVKMTCIPWLEEDGDGDARFWQIYCALTDTEPGPSAEWTKRGQTVSKSSARIVPPAVARP
ncbi:MAG TPA: toll/interleukin-1 receptor domain-containing protein, partial [Vicinamibacterales bacterium]